MATFTPNIIQLLEADVVRTLGERHRSLVLDLARNVAVLDIDDGDDMLVEDVQQVIMDTYVDTTWPACTRHHKHPMWYRDGGWWCEEDEVQVYRLGELGGARTDS